LETAPRLAISQAVRSGPLALRLVWGRKHACEMQSAHAATRKPKRNALTQTDESNGGKWERRYGSSDATSSVRTAMKARAEVALWRRTERRERIV
jgi:hypothetical protein